MQAQWSRIKLSQKRFTSTNTRYNQAYQEDLKIIKQIRFFGSRNIYKDQDQTLSIYEVIIAYQDFKPKPYIRRTSDIGEIFHRLDIYIV